MIFMKNLQQLCNKSKFKYNNAQLELLLMLIPHSENEIDAFQLNKLEFVRSEVQSVTTGKSTFFVLTDQRAVLYNWDFVPIKEIFDVK